MFNKPFEIVKLENHIDPRGGLFEVLRFKDQSVPGEGQLYCYTVNPHFRRGDHFHEKKHEWTTCVSGEVTMLVEDAEGNQEKITLRAGDPTVVYCAPLTAHAVINDADVVAVIVTYSSTQHEELDPDTVPKFIQYA